MLSPLWCRAGGGYLRCSGSASAERQVLRGDLARVDELAEAGRNLDLAAVVDDPTAYDRLLDAPLERLALQRRPPLAVEEAVRGHRPGAVQVDDGQVAVGADPDGALARIDAEQ